MTDSCKPFRKWRKRGRPRAPKISNDTGTPELRAKRQAMQTAEAIDLCLERGIISEDMHRAALHFRWLYTLRYGTVTVQAVSPLDYQGWEHLSRDPDWLRLRELEYRLAAEILQQTRALKTVINVAVAGYFPKLSETETLREGLSLLAHNKKATPPKPS